MRYRLKPHEVVVFPFTGTRESAEAAKDWVSSHDIEDTEVSWQGDSEPVALDIINGAGIETLEAGDWLVILQGNLYAETKEDFEAHYEEVT